MSKTLSLDIKNIYQISIGVTAIAAACIMIVNIINVVQLTKKPTGQPVPKTREQQLIQAIQLTQLKD